MIEAALPGAPIDIPDHLPTAVHLYCTSLDAKRAPGSATPLVVAHTTVSGWTCQRSPG